MPLKLEPLTEADIPEYVNISTLAFQGGSIGRMLMPQPRTPERTQRALEREQKGFGDKNTRYMKVVDTETGQMIAGAKWKFYPEGRTEEDLDKDLVIPEPQADSNVEAEKAFFTYLYGARRKYMGTKPYSFLHVLVTHPDHHRRGAGNLVMQWGVEETDRLGLPSYVEGSEPGRPLYEKYGFVPVYEEKFDLAKFGIEGYGVATNTIQLREAKPKKT